MPEIVERGHLYIAQPPLYRAKRGPSERYLKDDRELEDYLVETSIHEAVLTLQDGQQIAGNHLRELIAEARTVRALVSRISSRVPDYVLEQVAIAGALTPEFLESGTPNRDILDRISKRLDALESVHDKGWNSRLTADGQLRIHRTLRGVTDPHVVDAAVTRSAEARHLERLSQSLAATYDGQAELRIKETTHPVRGPIELIKKFIAIGRKGISIQRYKGLGEMNAEQLRETTLDPNARRLLQVKVSHADEAQEVFSTLMGDVVEPRRDFIQNNALNVTNLDV